MSTTSPLTEYMRANALTVRDLADRFGVERTTIWRWQQRVPLDRVAEVARVTGIPVHDIRPDLFGEAAE